MVTPLSWHSLAAGLWWALAQLCGAAGQLVLLTGGTPLPRVCRFAPHFSPPSPPPSVCRCLLLRRPLHTGGCILDGDTDPCQSQLAEINMLGLKGLRAPVEGGEGCDLWAPCPALPALCGTPCAGAAHGRCLLRCPGLGPSSATPVELGDVGQDWHCQRAAQFMAGLRWASAHTTASFLLMRGVCIQLDVCTEPEGSALSQGVCIQPGGSLPSQGSAQLPVLPHSCYAASSFH